MSFIELNNLKEKIQQLYLDIAERNIQDKQEVRAILTQYTNEFNEFVLNENNLPFLFEISQLLLDLYLLIDTSFDSHDLRRMSIILKYRDEPVYYVFKKDELKHYVREVEWFFSTFQQMEKIKENSTFILLREKKLSNMLFFCDFVMDMNKTVIYSNPDTHDFYMMFVKDFINS